MGFHNFLPPNSSSTAGSLGESWMLHNFLQPAYARLAGDDPDQPYISWAAIQLLACIAAALLMYMDKMQWLRGYETFFGELLAPYIILNIPKMFWDYIKGSIGHWTLFTAMLARLFFPKYFPKEAELPLTMLTILVAFPDQLAFLIDSPFAVVMSLAIGGYLCYLHLEALGGYRNWKSLFTDAKNTVISVSLILLVLLPVGMLLTLIVYH